MAVDRRRYARYTRAERLEQIQRLIDAGMKWREVADELGLSFGAVASILTDPDGSKARARKDRYRGTCKVCGAKTDGSNGRAKAPDLCAQHSLEAVHPKVWTREAVVDAIQRFAAEHGRPPTAEEWITADAENHYPPRSAVYASDRKRRSQPFASWADAIEAAGFPRPRVGYYQFDSRERRLAARRKEAA